MLRGTFLSIILTAVLTACGGDSPTGPGHFTVIYSLKTTGLITADSIQYLDTQGQTQSVLSPANGWSVAFSVPTGQTIGGSIWLTASGAGSAVLKESWTGGGKTTADSAHTTTSAAGKSKLTLPAHTAN